MELDRLGAMACPRARRSQERPNPDSIGPLHLLAAWRERRQASLEVNATEFSQGLTPGQMSVWDRAARAIGVDSREDTASLRLPARCARINNSTTRN